MFKFLTRHLFSQVNARKISHLILRKRLKEASHLMSKLCDPLQLSLEWSADEIFTKVRWVAEAQNQVVIKISTNIPGERVEFFINRLMFTIPLISYYHQSKWFTKGEIDLNLDDSADAPGLAFCSNRSDNMLIPDAEFLQTCAYQATRAGVQVKQYDWENRLPIVFWRGSSTGIRGGADWQSIPRVQLHRFIHSLGQDEQSNFDVGISALVQLQEWEKKEFLAMMQLKSFVPMLKSINYRYQLDIDGNTNAWGGLFQKMLMGCTVFKVQSPHGFSQWYYPRLEAFIHYIPIQSDLSDLLEKAHWALHRPKEAKEIAKNSEQLANQMTYEGELELASKMIGRTILGLAEK